MSGDIGNPGRPLLDSPKQPPQCDVVVMESTYGDRDHKPYGISVEEFYDAIEDTFRRGGNVLIPAFALERAQEIIYALHDAMMNDHRLPKAIQVFLDSPMAITATDIFRRHNECLSQEVEDLFKDGRDPLSLPGLHLTHEAAESMRINAISGGAVIIAGSGMATGGRIRHHLKHNLWRADAGVVFVGFAAEGTLARVIIDGAKTVRILGEEIPVRAKVYTINGFSAHAGQSELVAWHQASRAARTYLVHGEEAVMRKLAPALRDTEVLLPAMNEAFEL
jgi:metallo-beta-lactamase family protein